MSEAPARGWRWVAPLSLVLLLASAGLALAEAARPIDAERPPLTAALAAPGPSADAGVEAPSLEPVLAVEPTVTPAPRTPQIQVILPPPPPPVASSGSGRTARRAQAAQEQAATSGITTTAQWCATHPSAVGSASSLTGLLSAANAERAVWGLPALSWSDGLASGAQSWSDTMASTGNFAHGGSGYSGQNIYMRWSSEVIDQSTMYGHSHRGWMASEGHCNNILRSGWSAMGAGIASADGGYSWYVTVNFS